MKRDYVDVFHVERHHEAIHARLLNWAAWVSVRPHYATSPMFQALGVRSNSRQWHAPDIRDTIDTLDAAAMEKMIHKLPAPHADAMRWWYVYKVPVGAYCRAAGVNPAGALRLCTDARTMLANMNLRYNAPA